MTSRRWNDVPASTLEATEAIETAADSLMRLRDPQNAIRLYTLALKMRAEAGYWYSEKVAR